MRIRRRNWIIKRIALGFAVAALAAPAAAQARVDEGGNGQPNAAGELGVVITEPGVLKPGDQALTGGSYVPFVTDFPSYAAQQHGYVLRRDGNAVDTNPVLRSSDLIENVRLAPRGSGEVVASSGFDWNDGAVVAGIVAGVLVLGGIAVRMTRKLGEPQTA